MGLILTCYSGYMEIFDNCDFNSIWQNVKSSDYKTRGKMSLALLDYSEALDMYEKLTFVNLYQPLGLLLLEDKAN